jgi:hypothetical protein
MNAKHQMHHAVTHQPKLLVMTTVMEFSSAKPLAAQIPPNMTQSLEPVMTLALLLKVSTDVMMELANNAVMTLLSVLPPVPALLPPIAVMLQAMSGVTKATELSIVKLLKIAARSMTKTTTQSLDSVADLDSTSTTLSQVMER